MSVRSDFRFTGIPAGCNPKSPRLIRFVSHSRIPGAEPEREFTIRVTETELNLLLSALEHLGRRQRFLANLATNQARENEARARTEAAAATVKLSERLYAIGAQEAR